MGGGRGSRSQRFTGSGFPSVLRSARADMMDRAKSRNLEKKSNRKGSHRLETSAAALIFPPHQRDANPHNHKKYPLLQASTSMLGLGSEKVRKVPRALSQMPSRWGMEKAEGTC